MTTEARLIVNIDVPDLAEAARFYGAALGLSPTRRLGEDSLELTGLPTPIWLLRRAADEQRNYARHWTPMHLDIAVDDLDAAIARATAAGAVQEGDVGGGAWGRIATFGDPFGHGFCLIQFSDAGYDAEAEPVL